MSACTDNNLLPSNAFKVLIGGSLEYPRLNLLAVGLTFPGISNAEVSSPYRNREGYVPSETLVYEPLSIRFMCDERLELYDELFGWMKANTRTNNHQVDDITINLLTSHNNISREVRCTDAFPTSISSVDFDAQSSEVTFATFDVSFRFDEFEFID